jgi:hypothetical protein
MGEARGFAGPEPAADTGAGTASFADDQSVLLGGDAHEGKGGARAHRASNSGKNVQFLAAFTRRGDKEESSTGLLKEKVGVTARSALLQSAEAGILLQGLLD